MSGKKKKIYHQKCGATYSYTKQITYTLPHPPPPTPKCLKRQLAGHLVSTKPKTNNKEKIKRRQIFRTGVDFFEIRFAKTVIEVNHGPGGHFVLLSSWKKFCVPGKIHRKRFVQFLEIIFEWITRDGIFMSFQVLYHFQCVYSVSKIAYFNIDISYFLLTHVFY